MAPTVELSKEEKKQIKNHWTEVKVEDFWFKWYKKECLRKLAFNKKMDVFETHPTTGFRFENHSLLGYEACKGLVTNLAYRLLQVSQLISWDLAIDEEGHSVLIEVNLRYGDIDFHQIANGPLFGIMTEDVIRDVISYKRHNHKII